jgi:soluble lytic murein transglycosylase-like protein
MSHLQRSSSLGHVLGVMPGSFVVAGFLLITPVMADVLDISPDGNVTVYDKPAVFGPTGARAIARTVSVPSGSGIGELISQAATRYALNPELLHAVAWKESHFHSNAISPKGAVGIMQLMPDTARALGIDQYDPAQNIQGGAAYLRQMLNRYGENTSLALAAYNAGPGAVDRFCAVPPFAETQNYVSAIIGAVPGPIQSPLPFVTLVSR